MRLCARAAEGGQDGRGRREDRGGQREARAGRVVLRGSCVPTRTHARAAREGAGMRRLSRPDPAPARAPRPAPARSSPPRPLGGPSSGSRRPPLHARLPRPRAGESPAGGRRGTARVRHPGAAPARAARAPGGPCLRRRQPPASRWISVRIAFSATWRTCRSSPSSRGRSAGASRCAPPTRHRPLSESTGPALLRRPAPCRPPPGSPGSPRRGSALSLDPIPEGRPPSPSLSGRAPRPPRS